MDICPDKKFRFSNGHQCYSLLALLNLKQQKYCTCKTNTKNLTKLHEFKMKLLTNVKISLLIKKYENSKNRH